MCELRKHIRLILAESNDWGYEEPKRISFSKFIQIIKKNYHTDDARLEETTAMVLRDYFGPPSTHTFLKQIADPEVYSIHQDTYTALSNDDYEYVISQVSNDAKRSKPKVGQTIYVAVFPLQGDEDIPIIAKKIVGKKNVPVNVTIPGNFMLRSVNETNTNLMSPILVFSPKSLQEIAGHTTCIIFKHKVTASDRFERSEYATMLGTDYELDTDDDYIKVESVYVNIPQEVEEEEDAEDADSQLHQLLSRG